MVENETDILKTVLLGMHNQKTSEHKTVEVNHAEGDDKEECLDKRGNWNRRWKRHKCMFYTVSNGNT